jgi:hypothetical protein
MPFQCLKTNTTMGTLTKTDYKSASTEVTMESVGNAKSGIVG